VLPNGIGAQRNFNPPIQIELPGAQQGAEYTSCTPTLKLCFFYTLRRKY